MHMIGEYSGDGNPTHGGGARATCPAPSPAAAASQPTADRRRLRRAVHLDCEQLADGTWRVWSGPHEHEHLVNANATACNCEDFAFRHIACKHIGRVLLARGDAGALAQLRDLVDPPKRQRRREAVVSDTRGGSAGGQATTTGGAGATDTPPAPACAPLPLPEQEGGRPRCAR